MNEDEHKDTHPKMTGRKFIGIWAAAGYILGMIVGGQTYGPLVEIIAYKIGAGIPFALIGGALGAAVNYFFRSEKNTGPKA